VQQEMNCLALPFDRRGLVDETYKICSCSEHGIEPTYKIELYIRKL